MKFLILGHGGHGKDTVAQMISSRFGATFISSSEKASELFIYDALKEKYGYKSNLECFNDRHNHRDEWHDLICEYNKDNPSRLCEIILSECDMYVGMRDNREFEKAKTLFWWKIGIYDPRKPLESKDSFNIDFWNACDFIIPNDSTLEILESKVIKLFNRLYI